MVRGPAAQTMDTSVENPGPPDSEDLSGGPPSERRRDCRDGRDERTIRAGEAWAMAVREVVHKDGRKAAGGWPGTLSEAKAEMAISLGARPALGEAETSRLVRVFYEAARDRWLRHRERETRDE